jgi:hypothetical protein
VRWTVEVVVRILDGGGQMEALRARLRRSAAVARDLKTKKPPDWPKLLAARAGDKRKQRKVRCCFSMSNLLWLEISLCVDPSLSHPLVFFRLVRWTPLTFNRLCG